jgi:sialidase-1
MRPIAPSLCSRWRLACALAASHAALAGAPLLEKSPVFVSGTGGYAFYRVPGLVVTAKGTVLAYCEARRTGRSDWENIDLLLRRSTDGGKSWSAPRNMAQVDGPHVRNPVALARGKASPDEVTYSNPVAIAGRDGAVHFLFCLEFNRCFARRSDDDGVTFSPPVEFTAALAGFRPAFDWRVVALGPMHGIELASGRLVVAVWLALGTQGSGFHPSAVATIYSDDSGRTWNCGAIAIPPTAEWANPNSPAIARLAGDRVMINSRNESKANRRLVTVSPDGATHWSVPHFDDALLEPICEGSLVSVSEAHGGGLLFANPRNLARGDGREAPGKARDRRNLAIHLSRDDGRTWPIIKTLDPGDAQFSDLGAMPDGTILCLYEAGQTAGEKSFAGHNVGSITLARFNLEWLTARP